MKKITLTYVLSLVAAFLVFSQPTPVAYYPFNGNADDAGSNVINGTTYGNPTLTTENSGNSNNAYQFDGVDDYIDLGSSLILKPNAQVSLALWAYSSDWTSFSSWAALAGNTASGGYELIVHGGTGVLELEVKRNDTYGIAEYPLANISSGWHHFAMTFDGRYSVLYIDGIAVDTDDAGANYPIQYSYPGNSTLIGDEAGTGSTPEGDSFTGKIDEVRFYDVALTAQEVLTLYNSSTGIIENQTNINPGRVYPNPASDKLNIDVPEQSGAYKVCLNDITGKIICKKTVKINHGVIIFNRPVQVDAGFYMLTIESPSGEISSQKVVFN